MNATIEYVNLQIHYLLRKIMENQNSEPQYPGGNPYQGYPSPGYNHAPSGHKSKAGWIIGASLIGLLFGLFIGFGLGVVTGYAVNNQNEVHTGPTIGEKSPGWLDSKKKEREEGEGSVGKGAEKAEKQHPDDWDHSNLDPGIEKKIEPSQPLEQNLDPNYYDGSETLDPNVQGPVG